MPGLGNNQSAVFYQNMWLYKHWSSIHMLDFPLFTLNDYNSRNRWRHIILLHIRMNMHTYARAHHTHTHTHTQYRVRAIHHFHNITSRNAILFPRWNINTFWDFRLTWFMSRATARLFLFCTVCWGTCSSLPCCVSTLNASFSNLTITPTIWLLHGVSNVNKIMSTILVD